MPVDSAATPNEHSHPLVASTLAPSATVNLPPAHTHTHSELSKMTLQLSATKRKLVDITDELSATATQAKVLKEQLQESNVENKKLNAEVTTLTAVLNVTKEIESSTKAEAASLKTELGRYKKGTISRQLFRNEQVTGMLNEMTRAQATQIETLLREKLELEQTFNS